MTPSLAPVLLVSHGAATLTTRRGDPLDLALRDAARWLEGSRAVVDVSAHDVRAEVTVGVAPIVTRANDHPAATGLEWQARGDAGVARTLRSHLDAAGIPHRARTPRLDHGAWVPLRALDPNGTRPIVTVSLRQPLEPTFHLALGTALRPLRANGVAILASGGLTHDQEAFRRGWMAHEHPSTTTGPSERFERWALTALCSDEPSRTEALLGAHAHPDFAGCHPTTDHWLPALVASGAAGHDLGRVLHRGFQHSLSTAMVGFGLP